MDRFNVALSLMQAASVSLDAHKYWPNFLCERMRPCFPLPKVKFTAGRKGGRSRREGGCPLLDCR